MIKISWKEWSKKKRAIIASVAAGIIIIIVIVVLCLTNNKEEVVYRESTATVGDLTVGVTLSGNVSVGVKEQTFDLDISQYSAANEFSFDNMGGGNMGGMGMTMSSSSSSSQSSSDETVRELEIEEMYVSVGEEIQEGDPILKLNSGSVTSMREALESDATDAELTYKQAQTDQKLNDLSASQELETNTIYGNYAGTEQTDTLKDLEQAVTDAEESLEQANEELTELQEELAENQEKTSEYKKLVENAEYTVAGTDKETALYWWCVAEDARESAQTMLDDLENAIEQGEDDIASQEEEVALLTADYNSAKKELELGNITAAATSQEETLYYTNKDELYTVATASSALTLEQAEDDYQEAKEKLDDFNNYIIDDVVSASYSGVVTEIDVADGDSIYSDTQLLTVNSFDEVDITVTMEEEDKENVALGDTTNVIFSAFEDEVYQGEVTEISDAVYNNSTGVNEYEITVQVTENTSKLYESMSADIVFITKETKEVLYIPNRAVKRSNGKSYVLIKNENNKTVKQEITTGFSDGINVEVKEGLTQGDVVLIESKVSSS